MGMTGEDDLVELFGLLLNRAHDRRMAMAVGDHPPGGDRIDDAAAVGGKQISALAARDFHHVRLKRMLGERMPDRRRFLRRRFLGHHRPKSLGLNAAANASRNVLLFNGESGGSRPSRCTRPISQIALSLSGWLSPIKAIPRISIPRRRKASIESSE